MKYFMLLSLFISQSILSQNGLVVNGDYHLPISTHFVDEIVDFQQNENKIEFVNFCVNAKYQFFINAHSSIKVGFNYKYIDINVVDILDSINYYKYYPVDHSLHIDYNHTYYYQNDKPDYHNQSHSLGINFEYGYLFGKGRNRHEIGGSINYYFFEYFKGFYKSTELDTVRINAVSPYSYEVGQTYGSELNPLFLAEQVLLPRNFFTSAIDLQLYYQYNWNISDNFSLGVRAGIGTNLYSDWKQFKKYVWAGFGLNVGFLKNEKVRLNKGEL